MALWTGDDEILHSGIVIDDMRQGDWAVFFLYNPTSLNCGLSACRRRSWFSLIFIIPWNMWIHFHSVELLLLPNFPGPVPWYASWFLLLTRDSTYDTGKMCIQLYPLHRGTCSQHPCPFQIVSAYAPKTPCIVIICVG